MGKILEFTNIERENIFNEDFKVFDKNNKLDLDSKRICVLYAPNGTGKTSLAKVLNSDSSSKFNVNYNDNIISESNNDLFHIINDQLSRNIIKGETDEFLLGEDIRKEKELKKLIDTEFEKLFKVDLPEKLKSELQIKTKTSKLFGLVEDEYIKKISADLANTKSKGSTIDKDDFLEIVSKLESSSVSDFDDNKFDFLLTDYQGTKSIIRDIIAISGSEIGMQKEVKKIEQNNDAIIILEKFKHIKDCVVCDSKNIKHDELIAKKQATKTKIFKSLGKDTKKLLEKILKELQQVDPFNIKERILNALDEGNKVYIDEMIEEFEFYFEAFRTKIYNIYYECLTSSPLPSKYQELKNLLEKKPEIQEEDLLLIKSIIQNTIGKEIDLDRDESKNLVIKFDNDNLIDKDREELHLSTGEQNYLSLSFELLKAKNQTKEIIVLDDPISSFDSIFKNKIAFSILKILEKKKVIVLTHNTDLIKLLEHQLQKSFNLYLFNNSENEENGFIPVNLNEKDILLYLDKLLNLFRESIFTEIKDTKQFLISLIPFMRSYANITNNKPERDKLQKLMHGYETDTINISEIYKNLFGDIGITEEIEVSVNDILSLDISSLDILNNGNYPLLNKTLRHSLCYLFLRLSVEKKIVSLFEINTNRYDLLTKIIFKAFKDNKYMEERVFFTSRKTLLNEFNHFEGNMNIFQPAIDINDIALKKEIEEISTYLTNLTKK